MNKLNAFFSVISFLAIVLSSSIAYATTACPGGSGTCSGAMGCGGGTSSSCSPGGNCTECAIPVHQNFSGGGIGGTILQHVAPASGATAPTSSK